MSEGKTKRMVSRQKKPIRSKIVLSGKTTVEQVSHFNYNQSYDYDYEVHNKNKQNIEQCVV